MQTILCPTCGWDGQADVVGAPRCPACGSTEARVDTVGDGFRRALDALRRPGEPDAADPYVRALVDGLVTVDPEVMSGEPCMRGTRVPARTVVDYEGWGHTLAETIDCFQTLDRADAEALLRLPKTA